MFFKYSKIKTLNLSILVESIHYKIYVNDLFSIQFSEKNKTISDVKSHLSSAFVTVKSVRWKIVKTKKISYETKNNKWTF